MAMTASEFDALANATLENIAEALEESQAECDCEPRGGGVLELEFADGSRIVVNRHAAAQEIWIAAKSGGFHFRWNGANWVDTREGGELFEVLSRLASRQSGKPVNMKRP